MYNNSYIDFPPKIFTNVQDVNVTIYMPTQRSSKTIKHDQTMLKNIISKVKEQLPKDSSIVEKLEALQVDAKFWERNHDGVGIFANDDEINVVKLPRTVDEFFYVGSEFMVRPLIRVIQSSQEYLALGITKEDFVVYRGNRYGFIEVTLPPEVKTNIKDVLGDDYSEKQVAVVSKGSANSLFFGRGSRSDEESLDVEKFFRHIDKTIYDINQKSKLPIVLIGLTESQGLFRKISSNRHLLKNGVNKPYAVLDDASLTREVWEVISPDYERKTELLIQNFEIGRRNSSATDNIQDIFNYMKQNRIHQLVLEDGYSLMGTFDDKFLISTQKKEKDLFNSLALMAMSLDVEIVVLPKEKMPTDQGAFAILKS